MNKQTSKVCFFFWLHWDDNQFDVYKKGKPENGHILSNVIMESHNAGWNVSDLSEIKLPFTLETT